MLAKRLFDLCAALLGLLLLAPLLLLIAAAIRCDSRGPALFRQLRVGRHGRPFHILKFRTMAVGAEAHGQLSLGEDGRATRVGRVLRRHKLDELPQLVNVVLGQMSLVGPRPEVPRYVAHYPPAVRACVLSVRPGITDWAALRFRHEGALLQAAPDPEVAYLHEVLPVKLRYYVHYVRRQRLLTDLYIVLRTVAMLVFGDRKPGAAGLRRPRCKPRWRRRLQQSVHWGRHSALAPHAPASVLIAWLRGLAALQVAAAHLRAQVFPGLSTVVDPPLWYQGLAFITGFAHQAVVVFFVLSGWLVGGVLLDRIERPQALRDYAIDRLTRLWSVLLPAFAMMLLLSWGGALDTSATTDAETHAWSATTLLGNLVGLQTLAVPTFGANFPLWSLAYETWYYVLFPLLVLGWRHGPAWRRLLCAGLAIAIGIGLDAAMVGYFLVWLLGAAASRLRVVLAPQSRWACWGLLALLAAGLRLGGQEGDFTLVSLTPDLAYAALFALCLCSVASPPLAGSAKPSRLAATGAFLASFSFTLYVVHIPLQRALWAYRGGAALSPHDAASLAVYGALLAATVALAYLLHLPGEAQTARLRTAIRRRLAGQRYAYL